MSPQTVISSLQTHARTKTCSGPCGVEAEAPGASSLQSLTKHTLLLLSLLPFSLSTPPTPTPPRTCSGKSSASPHHLSSKVTVDTVEEPPTSSSSSSFHLTSPQTRLSPLSPPFSSSQLPNQAFRFRTKPWCSKISGSSTTLLSTAPTVKLAFQARSPLGCFPRTSSRLTNPEIWLENCSKSPGSATSTSFQPGGALWILRKSCL